MKISKIKLENFRSYREESVIDFNNLNVFVGKNDFGKSTILEALDIFFNEGKGVIKIDKDDVNKQSKTAGNTEIKISVIFEEFPELITIDATNKTNLAEEYLLNDEGKLEIIKKYPNAGKEKIFIKCSHPTNPACSNLLLKKQQDLRKLVTDDITCDDLTKNAVIRKSIWDHYSSDLQLQEIEIEITKIDAKDTWSQLKKYLPLYSLFRSDRENSDGDKEIQNPMKLAVQEILQDPNLATKLTEVAREVEEKLNEVVQNTLEKLNEMNSEIADSLTPVIPTPDSLKWVDVFKSVSITGDDDIPINKRGSGVKRLILLNFFRAEAERKRNSNAVPNIIYAIEEPETSQHPEHQRKLIEAFKELADIDNTQVLLTTHSPSIVKLLDFDNLKLIKNDPIKTIISVDRNELPYPSLNEVNYLAFGEADQEYHNELYGYLESEELLNRFLEGKPTRPYIKVRRNGTHQALDKVITEYIRHQIHHPENQNNARFSNQELQDSIANMRIFINEQN